MRPLNKLVGLVSRVPARVQIKLLVIRSILRRNFLNVIRFIEASAGE